MYAVTETDLSAAPAQAVVPPATEIVQAPIAGLVTALAEVPDPVFSGRLLGNGVAIDPTGDVLCAPCAGTVIVLHRAHHALTLRSTGGAEILMHVGLDTVALDGQGFTPHVTEGQVVAAGDPLISFALDGMAQQVKSLLIPVIVTNGEAFTLSLTEVDQTVAPGDALFTVTATGATVVSPPAVADGAIVRREVRMQDPHGIHARPAGILADQAKSFPATLTFRANGRTANARSAMSLMLLGVRHGDLISVEGQGEKAEAAVAAMVSIIEQTAGQEAAAPAVARQAASPAAGEADLPPFAANERAVLTAVQAAPGVAVGYAVRLVQEALAVVEAGRCVEVERTQLRQALDQVRDKLQRAIDAPVAGGGKGAPGKASEILKAHMSFLDDPELLGEAEDLIADGKSAAFAWQSVLNRRIDALKRLGNALLAERAADLRDLERQVILVLIGKTESVPQLAEKSILIAEDLLPSQLTGLDADRVAGFCLAAGGPTSHVAILAASMGIPALVAAGPAILRVPDGAMLILDADHGRVELNPPAEKLNLVEEQAANRRRRSQTNREAAQDDCRMHDGTRIEVVANLGALADVPAALAAGAEGCGLLRSEFLFLDRSTAPGEDEQLAQYQAIATALADRPLIIRTLDAGGDKDLPYVGLPQEANPALGLRGVRMSLWRPHLMRDQLRAILRVQPAGQCRLLLPMIATLADLRTVRAMLAEEQARLEIATTIPVGIMVEVPSAALLAGHFAAEVDFFSIGTNDLTQYTLAMDRTNPHLAKQLDAFHPAVLRLIAAVAEGARPHNRWIGVCGGLASFPLAAPVLIGLGVTELSATPATIPGVKAMVRSLTMETCVQTAKEALAQESAEAVRSLLARRWPDA